MARKVIDIDERGRRSFQTENFNLERFKESLSKNDNIMMSFATFEHGSQFNIMAPLADLDLHTFLHGKYDDFHQRCSGFTPQYLMKETWCLSVALKHLHEGLALPSGRVSCAHLDLKPENILVEWSKKDVPMDLPVGRWLISDFGISVVQGLAAGPHLTPGDVIRERSIEPPRDAGPFQAPEMQRREGLRVSTSSDRWSFGCIVTMILAFTLGGPEKVTELHKCRSEAYPDDYFYINTPTNGPVVKSEIQTWLSHQVEVDIYENHRDWISKCHELINGLLKIKQEQRLSNIGTWLEEIRALIEDSPTEQRRRLWRPERTQPQQRADVLITRESNRIPIREHTPRVPQQMLTQNPRPGVQAPFQLLNTPEPSTFARLEAPPNVTQTVLSACGCRVAFLSGKVVYVYALDQLHQQRDRWTSQNAPRRTERNSVQQFSQFPNSSRTRQWTSVLLAGDFIALESTSKHSNYPTV